MPDPQFTDNEIQQRAYKIYQARCAASGEPNADRQEAIQQLQQERSKKPNRSTFSWLSRSLTRFEKGAIEPTAERLDDADIFRIIEKISPIIEAIGIIAIPLALWWFSESSQAAKERQEKAIRSQTAVQNYLNQLSDTLTTGQLKSDEDLQTIVRASTLTLFDNPDLQPDPDLEDWENNRNDRKGQTIGYLYEAGLIQVEVPEQPHNNKQADEQKEPVISLSGANLHDADLSTDLSGADLSGADLSDAFLFEADLSGADLSDADLRIADLSDADLRNANFSGATLFKANLTIANLSDANLSDAKLRDAKLGGANLRNANFSGADLRGAFLRNANFSGADLSTVKYSIEEELAEAKLCNTKLPAWAIPDPDRDCEELGILPD